MSALPRSAQISTVRRRRRSTIAPAGSPTSKKAAVLDEVKRPTSNVVACSVITATRGIARRLTWLPSSLTDCPAHSSRKSRCQIRLPRAFERSRREVPLRLVGDSG